MKYSNILSKLLIVIIILLYSGNFALAQAGSVASSTYIDTPSIKHVQTYANVAIPEPVALPLSRTVFLSNLHLGSTGQDVRYLQQFLNREGFIITTTGAGSPGKESDYFGALTRGALIRFQEAHASEVLAPIDLVHGTGYFGSFTRSLINRMLSQ
ncbi:MAG TPA: peptidoglycan-binding domain-containing protein [Candidatus Paceibacterota bacterium]